MASTISDHWTVKSTGRMEWTMESGNWTLNIILNFNKCVLYKYINNLTCDKGDSSEI